MTVIKDLIDAGIAAQSVSLLGENYKVAKHSLDFKKKYNPKMQTKKILNTGIKNIVGIELLKTQAGLAGGL